MPVPETAQDLQERRWRVRRRWSPWRRRIRKVPDAPFLDSSLGIDGTFGAIVFVIALVLAIPALIVLAVLLVELLVLAALLPIVVLIRLLLPVPWTIEVWSRPAGRRFGGWQLAQEVRVVGWSASAQTLAELRERVGRPGADGPLAGLPTDGDQAPAILAGTSAGSATPNPFAQRDER